MKLTYWITTVLLTSTLLWSAYTYLFSQATIIGVRELGFPDFFRIQLAILKILAVLVILVPVVPLQFKEWAYAGVGLFYLTAIIAHIAHKDSIIITLINLVFIGLLAASYYFLHRVN